MIAVGVVGFAAGRNFQTASGPQAVTFLETVQPHVVLAANARRQKESRQQNEGCQVSPNEDNNRPKSNEDSSIMKGLVF
jgi:hypothetical protein